MNEELIKEIEARSRSEYKAVRKRLKRAGLNHLAHDTLREHFDSLGTVQVELTRLDFLALLAAVEHAKVHPDIVIQWAVREHLPGGYFLQGAQELLQELRASADVAEALAAQGIPYQDVHPAQLKEMFRERLAGVPRDVPIKR